MNNKNIKCKNNKNNNNNNTINKRNMKCKNNYNNKNKNNMFWETTTEIKTWAQVTLFSPHYLTRGRNNNKCKKKQDRHTKCNWANWTKLFSGPEDVHDDLIMPFTFYQQ